MGEMTRIIKQFSVMHLKKINLGVSIKKELCYNAFDEKTKYLLRKINKILIFGEILGSSACYMRSIFYITEFFDKRQI